MIARALRLIVQHPSTQAIGQITRCAATGTVDVEASLRVSMPNAWMAEGRSPEGVRAVEVVTLSFPTSYPFDPPTIRLRRDFERSLAHIQPGPSTDAPVPCIYDGDLRELLQRHGLAGILNQLVLWLEHAALGRLIDPSHGWEPVRRDSLFDSVVADGDLLRSLVRRREDHVIFRLLYWRGRLSDGSSVYQASLGTELLGLDRENPCLFFGERATGPDSWLGHSLAIVAWPAQSAGISLGSQCYQPETVADVGSLLRRSEEYGSIGALRSGLDRIKRCFLGVGGEGRLPLVIILVARRPFNLIHSDSKLEICPYGSPGKTMGACIRGPSAHRAVRVPPCSLRATSRPRHPRRARRSACARLRVAPGARLPFAARGGGAYARAMGDGCLRRGLRAPDGAPRKERS
jgi:Prokaryotic E2 family A